MKITFYCRMKTPYSYLYLKPHKIFALRVTVQLLFYSIFSQMCIFICINYVWCSFFDYFWHIFTIPNILHNPAIQQRSRKYEKKEFSNRISAHIKLSKKNIQQLKQLGKILTKWYFIVFYSSLSEKTIKNAHLFAFAELLQSYVVEVFSIIIWIVF